MKTMLADGAKALHQRGVHTWSSAVQTQKGLMYGASTKSLGSGVPDVPLASAIGAAAAAAAAAKDLAGSMLHGTVLGQSGDSIGLCGQPTGEALAGVIAATGTEEFRT